MSNKLPVFINGPITVYQLPHIPDDEFYLIDPALYAQALDEFYKTHDMVISEGERVGDEVQYTVRFVRNNVEIVKSGGKCDG